MPDSSDRNVVPQDWGDAFARLPLESAPANGWMQLQKQLPRPRPAPRRHRWPLRVATAAALLLGVWLPWQFWRGDDGQPSKMIPTPTLAQRTPDRATTEPPPAPVREILPPTAAATANIQTEATPLASTPRIHNPARRAASVQNETVKPAQTTLLAQSGPPALDAPTTSSIAPESIAAVPLEKLYAESAQLEAVLGQLRDDRVASGSLAALADDLEAQLGRIDLALSQPRVSEESQRDLWQQRVATLRHLTGLEGTQRWMAANGRQYLATNHAY